MSVEQHLKTLDDKERYEREGYKLSQKVDCFRCLNCGKPFLSRQSAEDCCLVSTAFQCLKCNTLYDKQHWAEQCCEKKDSI